ncbi:hypothetical protein AQI95_41470 [Streptomyces yokosukanensis]|uniref:Major facilitator superfamily (MFS) profile domain-containing protein n=1 Tax=Streptomyces yokosukanensis TaxID=67386 RepID=A0A117PXW2_9ACTN|nr:MFS transporter [Streptomyces yokosukanensis]KUM98061.1 hypothetical protein AQI95_41470 [Streptomyces yokosukanensis]
MSRFKRATGAIRQRDFRLLWAAQSLSSAGDAVASVAVPFAVLEVGGSVSQVGMVLAVRALVRLVLVLVGGVWSDRLPRRLVALSTFVLGAAVQLLVAFLLWTGHCRMWHLVLAAAVLGAGFAFSRPALTAMLRESVPASQIQPASSLNSLTRSIADVVGPAVGGLLLAYVGVPLAYLVDGLSFLLAASLLVLYTTNVVPGQRQDFVADLRAGWAEVRGRGWFLMNIIAHACWNMGFSAFLVIAPVLSRSEFGGAKAWGMMSAGLGVGAVVGCLISLTWAPRRPLVVANAALLPGALPLLSLGHGLPLAVVVVCCGLSSLGLAVLNEVWTAVVSQSFPMEVMGRVNSYDLMLSMVALPFGMAVWGPLSTWIGAEATLGLAAAVLGLPCLALICMPQVRTFRFDRQGLVVSRP